MQIETKNDDIDHFNDKVSEALALKMFEVATKVKDDFISDCGSGEAYGCPNINTIYGYHISGFIPSQLGGYEVSELYRHDVDTTYHITQAQSEAASRQYDHMYESFYLDHKEELEKAGYTGEAKDLSYNELPEELQNTFSDYENDWFEPALLRFELWVDDPEHKHIIGIDPLAVPTTIHMCIALNYNDQPYYRTKSDETLFQFEVPVQEFMEKPSEHWITVLQEKMKTVE